MNLDGLNFSIKADKLFLVIVGQKNIIEQLVNILNKNKTIEKYITTKINCPSAQKSLELMKEINGIDDDNMLDSNSQKAVIIDDGVEFAQGYINAEGEYNDNSYILQSVSDNNDYYVLSFIKFCLEEDDNPETIIEDWFKKNLGKFPASIKKSIKLITVAGQKSDILVVSTELKKI
jgi:hypothetical protein